VGLQERRETSRRAGEARLLVTAAPAEWILVCSVQAMHQGSMMWNAQLNMASPFLSYNKRRVRLGSRRLSLVSSKDAICC
jgi:hypothetical protein